MWYFDVCGFVLNARTGANFKRESFRIFCLKSLSHSSATLPLEKIHEKNEWKKKIQSTNFITFTSNEHNEASCRFGRSYLEDLQLGSDTDKWNRNEFKYFSRPIRAKRSVSYQKLKLFSSFLVIQDL